MIIYWIEKNAYLVEHNLLFHQKVQLLRLFRAFCFEPYEWAFDTIKL